MSLALFSTRPFQWLMEKYGYPLFSGVVRFVRTLLYAAAVSGVAWGIEEVSDLNLEPSTRLLALTVLLGFDKWLREHNIEKELG